MDEGFGEDQGIARFGDRLVNVVGVALELTYVVGDAFEEVRFVRARDAGEATVIWTGRCRKEGDDGQPCPNRSVTILVPVIAFVAVFPAV